MKKIKMIFVCVLFLFVTIPFSVHAGEIQYMFDLSSKLSESDYAKAVEEIKYTEEYIDMNLVFSIIGDETNVTTDLSVQKFADDFYDRLFPGKGQDGLLVLINDATKYDYISTFGKAEFYFTNAPDNDRIDQMLFDMSDYLKRNDYLGAVKNICKSIRKNYDKGVPKYYSIYDSNIGMYKYMDEYGIVQTSVDKPVFKKVYNWGAGFLTSFFISLCASAIIGIMVFLSYKKIKYERSSMNYITENDVNFSIKSDRFIREYVNKTKIQSSSSGGGGSSSGSSHRSSSGRSHGGGGRHR